MFGRTNSDTNKQGTVTIPFRFVWPYGGRRVLLSGSFARWQDHIPMSPMEGCPTVFQVIYPLTPGHHQYKFFVDGEWRHDEHQPHVSGTYGVVNTISLARDSDSVPANLGYDTAGRSSMEVDGDPLPPEANSSTSQAELDLSRIRVSTFLSSHTAYELLPESGKVIALDINLPVKQAFHILYEQLISNHFLKLCYVRTCYHLLEGDACKREGISVAPLWDFCKSQFVGVLSASDFILILRELGNHGSNLTEEELETHTISAWKEGKAHLTQQTSGSYLSRLVHAGSYDSLKDVALKLLQSKFSTVPIIHSSSPNGPCPHLLHLASLSGILKCICRHFRYSSSSLPILQKPICSFPLGTWVPKIGETSGKPIAMLRPNASLSAALSLLIQADVSSIPIVDENDSLVDIYCRSDITALAKDRVYAQVHLDDLSVHQAIQLGQDASSPHGFFSGQRCQMCLRSDPLQKVMERLSIPGVRRVIIVEAGSKRVEGIISLSDVFRFLLG